MGCPTSRKKNLEVTFHDISFGLLAEAIADNHEAEAVFGSIVDRRVTRVTGWDKPRVEVGDAAWLALCAVESELENHAYAVAQELSSAEWLWYLRRARFLFEGHNNLASTAPYMAAIAESIGAVSAAPPRGSIVPKPALMYPIDSKSARAVLRLAALAARLYSVQGRLRWAGKGSPIRSEPGWLPMSDPPPDLEAMVRLWDKRMEAHTSGLLSAAGLYQPQVREILHGASALGIIPVAGVTDDGRFALGSFDLGHVPTIRDENLPLEIRWPTATLDLTALLLASLLHTTEGPHHRPSDKPALWMAMFRRTAYRVMTRSELLLELSCALNLLTSLRLGGAIPGSVVLGSPDEVLDRLIGAEVCVWPPSDGPAIRPGADDAFFVDLWAATRRLARAIARPRLLEGEYANRWSQHFDASIQTAIDGSGWRPAAELAPLRGRHLTLAGKRITDVDAIGESGDRLLLVSCKCRPFSLEWDRGEYATVRNVASAVDTAVAEWADRTERLKANPHGDNYNFSRYREFIGVVVTPSVPWSPNPTSVAESVPGLRVAVSAHEFGDWLETRKPAIALE
jgi:hypothetical protein